MEDKLKRWIYATFGITFVLLVAIIVVWKLKFYDDVNAQLETTNKSYGDAQTKGATLDKELLAAAIARQKLDLAQDELGYFRTRFRSLNFDLTDDGRRNATWVGYMNEYFADYGLALRRELVQSADATNVTLDTKLQVDTPPQIPEQVTAPNSGFLKPAVGGALTVTVIGDLPSILRFFERVNRSAILMTVGSVKLEGTSPFIKATFTVTPYLVASGPSIQLQAAPGAATPAASGDANPEDAP